MHIFTITARLPRAERTRPAQNGQGSTYTSKKKKHQTRSHLISSASLPLQIYLAPTRMQRASYQVRRLPIHRIRAFASTPPYLSSDNPPTSKQEPDPAVIEAEKVAATQESTKSKTMAQKDAELMQKLAGISGDGGESGVEYEDGKASAMKRSVKNNMFRLI